MTSHVANLRRNYSRAGLSKSETDPNPLIQFQTWFDQALDADLPEPNAMTLATADSEGKPSARIVLLKGVDETGFVFYTNYKSRKGEQLAENPSAALVFWWAELERQVRIEGSVEKVSEAESEEYFASRPFGSQLGAWASPQSRVIESRRVLEEKSWELEQKYHNKAIPKPPHWGGYRLIPTEIEFWQGRPNRLHDRIRYNQQSDGNWLRERLAP
ncbi:pyridoxamine 5'-phosphate oxidase [Euhalothece natronophila Z-M001]|uniref:Pyridoxine/pyridoxamine 5'-phosphate oxidase n=1 Tax=Euhalothece natronophila Z-M001 TaxID=522448 RepID=A0A5B8NKJ9_9CHRO|nr:pyridoxamine 5'-phosphate oxidase [Euhalothece natronophila]QDZ39594.1 pyridoxamine 5'-phosphate oxidase [Euhalothece natronophila Z-M001]